MARVLNIGPVKIPILRVSMRVARNLPVAVKELAEEVREAREEGSDGGARVTLEEIETIVAHLFERLAEGVLPVVLLANGFHADGRPARPA